MLFLARGLALQPACVVGYWRDALVGGDYELGLRVTFDYGLWTAPADFELAASATRHPLVPPDFRIVEVKANDAVPLWLANMLTRHECVLRRYSKYCAGIERLAQLQLLESLQLSN